MPSATRRAERPLKRWELVGAWTGLWTAPKNVEVPPVPVRKLLIWGLGICALIAILLAALIPPLEHGKKAGEERLARQHAQTVAALAAKLRADQRLHSMSYSVAPLASLEAAITADAKARVAAGKLDGPVVSTNCKKSSAAVAVYPHSAVYHCFVTSVDNIRGEGNDVLATGYPFLATVYFAKHRLAWCKLNPQPGEQTRGKGLAHVQLSPVCAGKLAAID